MLKRDEWLDLARKLDWQFSYVTEQEVFPEALSGRPWLEQRQWEHWDEPYRTTFSEYVRNQNIKDASVRAVHDAVGTVADYKKLDPSWLSALKLHAATLPLAEFAAVVGNLRAARFGRDSAWRNTALFGALDECRHTQLPLEILHDLVGWDRQFDWTHKFFHTNDWAAVAGRHFLDELLLTSDPIEFAVGTNFVFESGFTNLQFVGLSAMAKLTGDHMFEKMVQSVQTDEARHAQIGAPVLRTLLDHDPEYAQYLVDKWFWRCWLFFAIVTGFAMDYLTPLKARQYSFREFVEEWILEQFQRQLEEFGLQRPWYWERFLDSTELFHHMMYASAYTHRASVWFDMPCPSPEERAWLMNKYPRTWPQVDPIWTRISERWAQSGPGVEWYTHGVTPVAFCNLCQFALCGGDPTHNSAKTLIHEGRKYIFCSEPCAWIFQHEPQRYAGHQGIVQRILQGKAPGNILELVHHYFGLTPDVWGEDMVNGRYAWLTDANADAGRLDSRPPETNKYR